MCVSCVRARQKDKAQQSERMLADMAAQMQQLRVEKEELQGRNQLLESLLRVQRQSQETPDAAQVCPLPCSQHEVINGIQSFVQAYRSVSNV